MPNFAVILLISAKFGHPPFPGFWEEEEKLPSPDTRHPSHIQVDREEEYKLPRRSTIPLRNYRAKAMLLATSEQILVKRNNC